jgi:acetolactate synthase-1/2/3 large subunit
MARQTGGEAIVESLARHGIDTIFGLPGVQLYGLFDALARNKNRLRLINARHEQTTAYMALGYAYASGKPAVYTVVPGPGVLNTTAALATAWGLNAKVVCLTGQVHSALIGKLRGQLHELPDQLATMKSLVKWAERIEHPTEAPRLVAEAFRQLHAGRPGPVALEMAWDQMQATADVTPCDPLPVTEAPEPDSEKIKALAVLVAKSKAPMIWVGSGATHAADDIRALAEKIGAPVLAYRTGRGILDDRHPLSLTVAAGLKIWKDTDLLIGFGTRLDVPLTRWGAQPAGLETARIDIDPAEMRRLKVGIGIVADSATAAKRLLAAVPMRSNPKRADAIAAAKAAAATEIQSLQPQMSFLAAMRDVLPENTILCDEMTQVGYCSWFGFPLHGPRTLITSGFSGTLGAGFPMALGVKVAFPDRPVVSITGDGGFLFGGTELATARQHGINLVTVLFNNSAYGNVMRDQRKLYDGRDYGAALENPDFQQFAKSFGVPSWKVADAKGLAAALKAALAVKSPTLIEVTTDITKESEPWSILFPARP